MNAGAFPHQALQESRDRDKAGQTEQQYSFLQILWVWALASVPGGLLFWLGLPVLDRTTEISTRALVLFVLVTPYFWHFLLALMILKVEGNDLSWNSIQERLWLRTPGHPRTGKRNRALWLWLAPAIAFYGLTAAFPAFQSINDGWAGLLPVREPAQYSFGALFENPQALVGDWGFFLAVLLVSLLTMSEEIIFRGILLPKMKGVFGRADWIANGFLFAVYHLDRPWSWPGLLLYSTLSFALPARLLRSTWFSTAVHLSQGLYFQFLILGLVLGAA